MTRPVRLSDLPDAAGQPALPGAVFRDGMSRVATAVSILTTDGPAGLAGLTATAVASVSDRPPTLLACVNRASESAARLVANGRFVVNTLAAGQASLADAFAGRTGLHGEARFGQGDWSRSATGLPLLGAALVAFECRLVEVQDVATHHVLIGEVSAVHAADVAEGLVYVHREYRGV